MFDTIRLPMILYVLASITVSSTSPLLRQENIIDESKAVQRDIQKRLGALDVDLDKEELTETPYLRFTKTLKDVEIVAGEKLVLKCEAIGVPPPVIEWTYNGNVVQAVDESNTVEKLINAGIGTIQNGVTASKLVISCVDTKHAAEYKCLARNGHQKLESSAVVTVEGSAKCLPKHLPPTISMWTDGRFERSGATVQLFCRVHGVPQAKITWYNEDEKELCDSKKYEMLESGDLLIHNTQWEDLGVYSCVARNEYGQDRIMAFFYPTEP